jgi:hypothetical protein
MFLKEGQLVKHKIPDRSKKYGLGIVVSYNRITGLYKVYWSLQEAAIHHVRESLRVL